jgi:heme/copper-type cytochrome/quinol oxidase subunit 2
MFQNYAGGGEATVSPFITFIILLAGVIGGLVIVVVVIFVCKYCLKGRKIGRR